MAPFSDEDSPVYLSPGFDANSLTVSALRGIFLEHNINHRPSAKKAELVDIFNQQLAPRARKIVRDRKRIRRTSMGIVDMSSSQEGSTVNGEDDEDESTMSLPPQRRQMPARASRRSTRGAVEKTVIEDPTPLKVSDRRKSTKHSRAESELTGDGDDDRTPRRKTRHIEEAPTVKVEDADTTPVGAPAADSPFTQDNPFQSGSSPIVSVEARRKSAAPRTVTRKSTSTSRRRTTAGSTTLVRQDDGVVPPSSSTFISPLVKWRRQKSPEHSTFTLEPAFEPTLEPSEEFTLEAQLEMEQEQHSNGQLEVRTTGKRQKRQSSGIFKSAPAVVLTTILAGYAAWWRQERIAVGYCGVGREPSAITLPEWASVLQPQCEPCPQHAYCYADMEARCESGFVLQSHPLSLGDVIPLAPSCEPDSTKHRKVKLIADKAVEELRERRARWECGDLKDESGKAVDRVEVDESTLKADVSAMRKRMSATEFEDLWKSAIGEILGREEVTSASNGYVSPYTPCTVLSHPSLTLSSVFLTPSLTRLVAASDPPPSSHPPLSDVSPWAATSDGPFDSRWSTIDSLLSF